MYDVSVTVTDTKPQLFVATHNWCYQYRECAGQLQSTDNRGSRQSNCLRNLRM
jgi:hypothetical protein